MDLYPTAWKIKNLYTGTSRVVDTLDEAMSHAITALPDAFAAPGGSGHTYVWVDSTQAAASDYNPARAVYQIVPLYGSSK